MATPGRLDEDSGTEVDLAVALATLRAAVADDPEASHLAEMLIRITENRGGERAGGDAELARRAGPSSHVTARVSGARPLAEADPRRFAELQGRYRQILLACLEQRAYRVSRDVRQPTVELAQELADLRADPRDCVALQAQVLRQLPGKHPEGLLAAAREESMMLLIEVLGYLARAYRDGTGRQAASR